MNFTCGDIHVEMTVDCVFKIKLREAEFTLYQGEADLLARVLTLMSPERPPVSYYSGPSARDIAAAVRGGSY